MEKVNNRRQKIYEYIVGRVGGGVSPSVREICRDLGISSTSTVHNDLHHMAENGLIEMDDGRNRTIRLTGSAMVQVPLLGTVTAGAPILAFENIEQYIPVGLSNARGRDLFALRVKGDSMTGAAILDKDIVVVEKTPVAENGQIVVAMIDEEATVKRFFREKGSVRLQPENDAYEPIISKRVNILGKVISVIRMYG
ncbi:MAG: transcriptional repressor LexA [Oscillospiraceae bacterium]|nr:transcriptional repressor LexA [Oscillospiraceae bacterium]